MNLIQPDIELLQRVSRWDSEDWHGFTVGFIAPADRFECLLEQGYFGRNDNLGYHLTQKGEAALEQWFANHRKHWNS